MSRLCSVQYQLVISLVVYLNTTWAERDVCQKFSSTDMMQTEISYYWNYGETMQKRLILDLII